MERTLSIKLFIGIFIAFLFVSPTSTQTGPPVFDIPYETVIFEENTSPEILCTATGTPPIVYGWFDQLENEILNGSSIFSVSSENSCTLFFNLIKRDHAGIYMCKASNDHGLVSKYYEIHVKPDDESENVVSIDSVDVKNLTESSVEFVVHTTGDFEYIDTEFQDVMEKIKQFSKFKKGDKIEYTRLLPAGNYTFRFQALSGRENLTDWFTTTVVLLPSVPEVIYRKLNDGFLQIEWFTTIDERMRGSIDKYTLTYYTVSQWRGTYWNESSCHINIDIPACSGAVYSITNLFKSAYYVISLKAHTEAGYGKSYKHKISTY